MGESVLMGESGDYEDCRRWPVRVFPTYAAADLHCAHIMAFLLKNGVPLSSTKETGLLMSQDNIGEMLANEGLDMQCVHHRISGWGLGYDVEEIEYDE